MANGIITIEEARDQYLEFYKSAHSIHTKCQLKAWMYHSESRRRNNNPPYSFSNYCIHIYGRFLVEQIEFGMIDISDLGTKEEVIEELMKPHHQIPR